MTKLLNKVDLLLKFNLLRREVFSSIGTYSKLMQRHVENLYIELIQDFVCDGNYKIMQICLVSFLIEFKKNIHKLLTNYLIYVTFSLTFNSNFKA